VIVPTPVPITSPLSPNAEVGITGSGCIFKSNAPVITFTKGTARLLVNSINYLRRIDPESTYCTNISST
jgi:hypothetical protein